MRRNDAETLALKVLTWLASDPDMLRHFCAATGTAPTDLGTSAGDAEFLAGVLDFLALDNSWILSFSSHTDVPPETLTSARAALPGGDLPHWT